MMMQKNKIEPPRRQDAKKIRFETQRARRSQKKEDFSYLLGVLASWRFNSLWFA
jgi:hypothetical protein